MSYVTETTMGAALSGALGVDAHNARLATAAWGLLRQHNGKLQYAVRDLVSLLKADYGMLEALAFDYLVERARDMRNELPGEGHGIDASREADLPVPLRQPHEDGADHSGDAEDGRTIHVRPSSPNSDDAGHVALAVKAERAMPASSLPYRGGKGHASLASKGQSALALPAREPTAAQRAATRAAAELASGVIFDTFKVQGRSIGDLRFGEIRRLAKITGVEHYVLVALDAAYPNAQADLVVRNLVSPAALQKAISEAREAADVVG